MQVAGLTFICVKITLSSIFHTPQVHFNKDLALRRELTPNMFGPNDIVLSIIEPLTNNKEETLPIKVCGVEGLSGELWTEGVTSSSIYRPDFFSPSRFICTPHTLRLRSALYSASTRSLPNAGSTLGPSLTTPPPSPRRLRLSTPGSSRMTSREWQSNC